MNEKTYEKHIKWKKLVAKGGEDAFIVGYHRDRLKFFFKGKCTPIEDMIVAADYGNGLRVIGFELSSSRSNCENKFQLTAKDDNKLITLFEDGTVCSFGFDGAISSINTLFFYLRCRDMIIIVAASKDRNSANIIKRHIGDFDIITPALFEIILNKAKDFTERDEDDECFLG